MKPVSQEEYTRMQAEDWEWAKALIQCQKMTSGRESSI